MRWDDEWEWIGEGNIVVYFKALFSHSPGGNEKT